MNIIIYTIFWLLPCLSQSGWLIDSFLWCGNRVNIWTSIICSIIYYYSLSLRSHPFARSLLLSTGATQFDERNAMQFSLLPFLFFFTSLNRSAIPLVWKRQSALSGQLYQKERAFSPLHSTAKSAVLALLSYHCNLVDLNEYWQCRLYYTLLSLITIISVVL